MERKLKKGFRISGPWIRGHYDIKDGVIFPINHDYSNYDPLSEFSIKDCDENSLFMKLANLNTNNLESIKEFVNEYGLLGIYYFRHSLPEEMQSDFLTNAKHIENVSDFQREVELFRLFLTLLTALRKGDSKELYSIFFKQIDLLQQATKTPGLQEASIILTQNMDNISEYSNTLVLWTINDVLHRGTSGINPHYRMFDDVVISDWSYTSLLSAIYLMAFQAGQKNEFPECDVCYSLFVKSSNRPVKLYCSNTCKETAKKRRQRSKRLRKRS